MNRIFRLYFPENRDFYRSCGVFSLCILSLLAGRKVQDAISTYPYDFRTLHSMGHAGRGNLVPPSPTPFLYGDDKREFIEAYRFNRLLLNEAITTSRMIRYSNYIHP